jgi:hypothetical protein
MEAAVERVGERRRQPRRVDAKDHRITTARVRPGYAARVIDVSAEGALIETAHRLLPGSAIELHLATADDRTVIRARVLRCGVAQLHESGVFYRGAVRFERHLSWLVDTCYLDCASGSEPE